MALVPQNFNRAPAPPQNYNTAPLPAAQNYNTTPQPAAQNYNTAPQPAAQNYSTAPLSAAQKYNTAPPAAQNYNPALAPAAQSYNPALAPAAQNYDPAFAPAAQNYNPALVPAAQNYNPALVPAAQNYYKPPTTTRRGGDSYNRPPLFRDGRAQFSATSDDSALTNQILATDRSRDRPYDVASIPLKHILQTVDVILARVTKPDIHGAFLVPGAVGAHDALNLEQEKALHATLSSLPDNYDVPTGLFNAISCEWLSGEDPNKTTMDILDIVQHHDWDEKVVLVLGAFAVKDGEFWLVAQLYTTNPLAKAIGQLKQVQEILERAGTTLKPKFDSYNNLVRAIINVTKSVVQLYDLQRDPHVTTEHESAATTAHIPTAVYWTIRSIVVAASQLVGITGMGPEYLTEAWELSSLAHKLENIQSHLQENLDRLQEIIKRKKDDEALALIGSILETPHIDNTKPLRVLFYKDDLPALYDCYNKKRVDIDVLKRKTVILFISDLDVVHENEYMIVQNMYMEKRQSPTRPESQYEVVWVPIVDTWTDAKYQQFEELRRNMEWYTVFHPSVVSPTVIRYIRKKDKWNFQKKPLLVVLDPQGKIVHTNAVHMMCIWGSIAFPFTSSKEKLLWEDETWRIELLADSIDQNLFNWIAEGKYICLYGGEDMEWIRNFTRAAKKVAAESGIQLELLYVGKSKPKEKVVKNIMANIQLEKLSHTLEWNLIWFFWVRLESMWQSRGQQLQTEALRSGRLTDSLKNDAVMQGIISMLSFGSSDRGWAVIGTGTAGMSKANGEHMFRSLNEFNLWNRRVNEIGFVPALNEYLAGVYKQAPHHCTSLILPATGLMPETVACAECGRLMERFTMFRCCTD
ncbi:protein SIEVE ELEMENT OCCLUSION B-like [Prunus yedoensis var. nudiflora]|uniref:Protein SIEVE ELEMENT OCCLUSION B-like n=1 Tax=Prunus yedoensis var. nudiflora TaxID=2094558 RepID=A0A314YG30_PRUYE|nr:protein SIEVE ELEMENT OCCLUSION B-like [Prunus yedoensis var. nudiflora]